ncbi:Hypothetical protein FKW44_023781 [Caligus rogercresseyi]|uniref:Uncharacterized protein n=1 Tax=Caligus rogercresseyi TaxID=217165 RepID=A0A7T8JUZ9_CALRO|nr:Hypothetical protein FKW44_023781 [Caligus rogercresseyi]
MVFLPICKRSSRVSNKKYSSSTNVWVRCYGRRRSKWIPGTLVESVGTTVWKVKCEDVIFKRPFNQLRPRKTFESAPSSTASLIGG